MFLSIISPTSGSFQLVPQTLNNSPLVDLYMNRKLVTLIRQARSARAGIGLDYGRIKVLLSQLTSVTRTTLMWEKLYVKTLLDYLNDTGI